MWQGILAVSVAVGVLSGCVAQSKYRALESKSTMDRTSLAKELAGLRAEKEDLERKLAGLHDEIARRETQTTAQKSEVESLQGQIASLNARLGETETRAAAVSTEKDEEISRLRGTYDTMVKSLESEIAKGEVKVKQIRDRLSVQMVEKILFDSGKAEIRTQGMEVLAKVATVLRSVKDKQIRIEGYTDSVPIGAGLRQQFATNWELSTQRASTVLRFLQEKGSLDGKYLSAVGYGPFRPIASNETSEGRAENRRIEIVLTPLDVGDALK
jgi:chemotaxis protein MotB